MGACKASSTVASRSFLCHMIWFPGNLSRKLKVDSWATVMRHTFAKIYKPPRTPRTATMLRSVCSRGCKAQLVPAQW